MSFILSFLMLALITIIGALLSSVTKLLTLKIIYVVSVIFIVCGLVTYTPDWDGYSNWMTNDSGRDLIFQLLSSFYSDHGYDYSMLHMTYVILHASMLVYLVSKLTKNYSFVILIYISIIYLFYTTQIRFFLAYFSYCVGVYLIFLGKPKRIAGLFLIFAVLNHSAVVLMFPFAAFLYVNPKKLGTYIIFSAGVLGATFMFLNITSLLPVNADYFADYLSPDVKRPGLLGSLLIFAPYAISAGALFFLTRQRSFDLMPAEKKLPFRYAWCMSLTPMIYLPIAMGLQIVGQRLIVSSLIFHLCAWTLLLREEYRLSKPSCYVVLICIWAFFLSFAYGIPSILGLENYFDSTIKVFQSNILL